MKKIKFLAKLAFSDSESLDFMFYFAPVIGLLVSIIIFLELNKELWK